MHHPRPARHLIPAIGRLLLGAALLAGPSAAGLAADDTVSTCRNSHDTKCLDCYDEEVAKNSDGSCPIGSHSVNTSWVDNVGFEHHHEAWDYLVDQAAGALGCVPCGASAESARAETGRLPTLALKRVHRYRFSAFPSAFGPGAFSGFDDHLQLDRTDAATGSGRISYFRVDGNGRVTWTETSTLFGDGAVDGIYHDQGFANYGELRLLAADNTLVADQAQAATAVVRNHDGSRQVFEIIRISGDVNASQRWGRLVRREDRNGNAIVIAYAFPRDASSAALGGSRAKLWQMATVTDAHGRSASFTYGAAQVAGRWVVSGVALPNGGTVAYGYDANGLNRITLADGAVSTIARSADNVAQQTIVHYEEAAVDGIHRRKDARMTNNTYLKADGTTVSQTPGMIRSIVNGAGELTYFNHEEPGNPQLIHVYEGGSRLLRITTSGFDHPRKVEVATDYVPGGPLAGLTYVTLETYSTNAQAMILTNTDNLGRARRFERDPRTGRITRSTRRDGTSAIITYANDFARPSTVTDRLGRVSERLFDARGNLISRTEAKGTADQATWRWTYNDRGQVLKAFDALYDPARPDLHVTDHFYDAQGQLVSIVESADVAGGARPTRLFVYDAAGRLVRTTDPDGRTVEYTYDSRNRVVRIAYGGNAGVTADFETFTWAVAGADVNLLTRHRDRNGNLTEFGYDLAGRRTSTTWAAGTPEAGVRTCTYLTGTELPADCVDLGDRTTRRYDHLNREVVIARQATSSTTLTSTVTYDNARRVAWTSDPYGRKTWLAYDLDDRAIRTVRELVPGGVPTGAVIATLARSALADPPYLITDTAFDAEDQRLSVTDGRGIREESMYDAQGRLVLRIQAAAAPAPLAALNLTTRHVYDAQGNRTLVIHPRTQSEGSTFATATTYSGRNLPLSITEAVGRPEQATRSRTYTRTGKPASERDFRGNTTVITYHPCCDRVKDITDPAGGRTTYAYDFQGNLVSVTDANGSVTTSAFDGRHRLARVTNPEGEVVSYAYDDNGADTAGLSGTHAARLAGLGLGSGSDGSLVQVTNALGESTLRVRDGVGRTVRTVDGNGNATTISHDVLVAGLVATAVTDPGGHITSMRSDGADLVREEYDAEGAKTTTRHDANGNRVAVRDPNGVGTDCGFDAADREVSCSDTVGSVTRRAYDAHGSVTVETDALLKETRHAYDGRGRRTSTVDRIGGVTTFTYDANGNLLAITDAEGRQTRYAYDSRDLLTREILPPGQATPGIDQDGRSYAYDAGLRLRTRTDQAGVVTTYGYDRAGRLLVRAYPDGLDDAFAYDDAGRLITATSRRYATGVTRSYDAGGRLTAETQTVAGSAYTVGYAHDMDDQVSRITYPDGKQVTRTYTARHQLATVAYDGTPVATRAYDAGGRPVTTTAGNGLVETRTYRADDTVASIVVPGVTNFTYTYDANKWTGVEGHHHAADEQRFGYDAEGRLIAWRRDGQEQQNWTLTTVGDWAATVRTGPAASSQTRTHSAAHEVTGIVQGAITTPLAHDAKGNLVQDHAGQRYDWDHENRLAAAVASAATSSYRYDALGRRLGRVAHGRLTVFVHDGEQVIAEYEAPLVTSQAIGAPTLAGSFSEAAGTITLAAGGVDIWGTSDQFRYAYAPLTGDGTVTVKVTGQTASHAWAKSGLMLRESLAADARNVAVLVTPGNGASFQRRPATGGVSTSITTGPGSAPLPQWLRLRRSGSTITGYRSADGVTWTLLGSETLALPATVQVGLAVSSHEPAVLCTATFTNLSFSAPGLSTSAIPTFARALVFGSYVDEALALITPTARHHYHANHLHSVAALSDAAGAVAERYRYDAYGTPTILAPDGVTVRPASALGNRIGFTGREFDAETGQWHFRARQLSGGLGRFTSRDALGYVDGYDLYAAYFVPNRLDPSGNELVIKVLEDPTTTSKCGGARSKVQWTIKGEDSGWVVQHIVFAKDRKDCKGDKLEPIGFVGEYYEAWRVVKGKVYIGASTTDLHGSDTFQIADQGDKTKGTASIKGEVRFIKDYELKMPPWKLNDVAQAGSLPTMKTTPPGWGKDGDANHTLEVEWDCCTPKDSTCTGKPLKSDGSPGDKK